MRLLFNKTWLVKSIDDIFKESLCALSFSDVWLKMQRKMDDAGHRSTLSFSYYDETMKTLNSMVHDGVLKEVDVDHSNQKFYSHTKFNLPKPDSLITFDDFENAENFEPLPKHCWEGLEESPSFKNIKELILKAFRECAKDDLDIAYAAADAILPHKRGGAEYEGLIPRGHCTLANLCYNVLRNIAGDESLSDGLRETKIRAAILNSYVRIRASLKSYSVRGLKSVEKNSELLIQHDDGRYHIPEL